MKGNKIMTSQHAIDNHFQQPNFANQPRQTESKASQPQEPLKPQGFKVPPAFVTLVNPQNETYNFGTVAGLSALNTTVFSAGNLMGELINAKLEKQTFTPNWKGLGKEALVTAAVSLVTVGLLEAWRTNNAKSNNQNQIKLMRETAKLVQPQQKKPLSEKQIAQDLADNGTLDGSAKST
jgi:hypothetical protein